MKNFLLPAGKKGLAIRMATAGLLLSTFFSVSVYASLDEKLSWDDGWQYAPEQRMEDGDFSKHVKHLCLNQVHEEDLDAKYLKEYLDECAADYGVFDLASN